MVTFANGVQISAVPYGGTAQFQNAQRKTLEFRISKDSATFEELEAIYTDTEATRKILVVADDNAENQSLHLNFTLGMKLGTETIDGVDMWVMKLAQKSDLEIALEQQALQISAMQSAIVELGEIAGGEE